MRVINRVLKNENQEKATELSKYIWSIKRKNKPYEIKWKIIDRAGNARCGQILCKLCLKESLAILKTKKKVKEKCLNKRTEILNKCRHDNKFLLRYWQDIA